MWVWWRILKHSASDVVVVTDCDGWKCDLRQELDVHGGTGRVAVVVDKLESNKAINYG